MKTQTMKRPKKTKPEPQPKPEAGRYPLAWPEIEKLLIDIRKFFYGVPSDLGETLEAKMDKLANRIEKACPKAREWREKKF